jgi:signal transduction histidine kinase
MGKIVITGKQVWFTLAGVAFGILLVHPVAMLVYTMQHHPSSAPLSLTFVVHQLGQAFGPYPLRIGLVFAILGGVAGWFMGSWFLQKKRLEAEKIEHLRSITALETLKELMVTLAHYIRNANMVVGGFSDRLSRCICDPDCQKQLSLIQEASREIDAVIAALQDLTEISTVEYTASSHESMIDLKKDLEARLAKAQVAADQKQE